MEVTDLVTSRVLSTAFETTKITLLASVICMMRSGPNIV